MRQHVARGSRPLQTVWLALLSLGMAARYLWVYAHFPLGPGNPEPAAGWFTWADQAAYFLAAHAWAHGNLDSTQHLYPAGYGLLAAPFVWLTPAQPFVIPDLLCWLGSLWLFAALGARLTGPWPGARAIAGTVFALVEAADSHALYTWEIPWTSTPAATLTFASLLLALRHAGDPRPRRAVAAAALASLIVLFRPTDALIIMPAVALAVLWSGRRPFATGIPALLASAAAFATGPALLLATHVATHGWTLGAYFANSRLIGFEWRLLPLRWVTLLLSPRPLYPSGEGLAEVYWFILPGMAGILAAVFADSGRRRHHAIIGGAAIAFVCLYLCYRDLHVLGLFSFQNQHYFKWTIPVFGLYALGLAYMLVVRRRAAASAAAIAIVAALACWRAQLMPAPQTPAPSVLAGGIGLALPGGLPDIAGAVLVRAPEDFLTLYFGQHTLVAGERVFGANAAFKVLPIPLGFMVIPLRPLPASPSELHLAGPLRLDPAAVPVMARQAIVFGVPCLIAPWRRVCQFKSLMPPG